jgi:hypothetical protein
LLRSLKPWDEQLLEQLLWTSANDADIDLRAAAAKLQAEGQELTDEQLLRLAGRLAADRSVGVRVAILAVLKDRMRVAEVRAAVADAFADNPAVFDDAEFEALTAMLAPYVSRDEAIRDSLLKAAQSLPRAAQRNRLLQLILPKLKPELIAGRLAALFNKERDAGIRQSLFDLIKPLSVARHPELVALYCDELVEPSSPFRQACAGILAAAAETHPAIPPALEDVLRNDQDRELLRTCLDGYLKPSVPQSFDVLLSVVGNEAADATSRQRCLDQLLKLPIAPQQQEQLTQLLAGLKPNILRMPT